jgi:hypothetical protein
VSHELEEDSSILHNKIDNLEFQIHLKVRDIKNATEENHTLNCQNKGLRLVIMLHVFIQLMWGKLLCDNIV